MAQMETWTEFKSTVEGFLPTVSKADASTVKTLLSKGDNNTGTQTKVTSAIKLMLEDYDGCPIVGRAPAISGDALTTLNSAISTVGGFADIFDSNEAVRGLLLPHGRSKESTFADGAAFVAFRSAQMRRNAISAAKSGWDGSTDSIVGHRMGAN